MRVIGLWLGCCYFRRRACLQSYPVFFAVKSDLSSTERLLIGFDADGEPVSTVSLPDDLVGSFLAISGSDLFIDGSSGVYRRAIESVDNFEFFAPGGGLSAHFFAKSHSLGGLHVANYAGAATIVKQYDPTGQGVAEVTLPVNPTYWLGFDVDRGGNFYVLQRNGFANPRLLRFMPSGSFDTEVANPFLHPFAVTIDNLNQRLYVGHQLGGVGVFDISQPTPALLDTWSFSGIDLQLSISLDSLTGHVLVAGLGGVYEVDADGAVLVRNATFDTAFTGVVALNEPNGIGADLNGDGDLDQVDLDAMNRAVVGGSSHLAFDLSGDGLVTMADLDTWMAIASTQNLPSGQTYQPGDANLDGFVDGGDFSVWNQNKFTRLAAWSKGDFNSDGFVDGQDCIVWNNNKSIASVNIGANLITVPAPVGSVAFLLLVGTTSFRRNRWRTGSP